MKIKPKNQKIITKKKYQKVKNVDKPKKKNT